MRISFKSIIGKHILVGITWLDAEGGEPSVFELHGTIVYAKANDCISIKVESDPLPEDVTLDENGLYFLPPDLPAIKEAQKGIYTLRSTGEKVTNPDLLASWCVRPPQVS